MQTFEEIEVCSLSDLVPGRAHSATVGRVRVAVVNYRDEVKVFHAGCPHHDGPLDKGRVLVSMTSDTPR